MELYSLSLIAHSPYFEQKPSPISTLISLIPNLQKIIILYISFLNGLSWKHLYIKAYIY